MLPEYITMTLSRENIERYAATHTEYYSSVGYYKNAAGHSIVRKMQDFYLLMLCVDGSGMLHSGGRMFEIQKGDCMVCHAGGPISYASSADNPWSLYWIHFALDSKSPLMPFLYNDDVNPQKPVANICNKLAMIELFERILKFNDILSDELQFCFHQNMFLALLYTGLSAYKKATGDNDYIAAAVKYIENNMNRRITLSELAGQVHLSRYHFSRLFQKTMQVPPSRYIVERRIQYAKTLLVSSSLSIGEIALAAGFENGMYFSKVFKRYEGVSPKRYRVERAGK